jgi:hypothetical protein
MPESIFLAHIHTTKTRRVATSEGVVLLLRHQNALEIRMRRPVSVIEAQTIRNTMAAANLPPNPSCHLAFIIHGHQRKKASRIFAKSGSLDVMR